VLPVVKRQGRKADLSLRLVPILRISGVIPPLLRMPSWCCGTLPQFLTWCLIPSLCLLWTWFY